MPTGKDEKATAEFEAGGETLPGIPGDVPADIPVFW
jgi:hypothetical protein